MRRLLLTTALALTLTGAGYGVAQDSGADYNWTLTCGIELPPYGDCFLERRGFSLFGLEGGIGFYGTVDFYALDEAPVSLGGFTTWGYYAERWAVVAEVRTPKLGPIIGDVSFLRLFFSYRW